MQENNQRIAKNTLILYFRMFITMGISLYTSRLVLATLGVEDFGIYNIVGGVVIFFAFVNNALVGATQRFINFALVKGNIDNISKTFSMCVSTHIGIAIFILLLAETIGLYFIYDVIQIPPDRVIAAHIVYQFSILVCCVNIIRTPYNASIIAHERMSFFAWLSIGEGILKLAIVYILLLFNTDKLILYAILMLITTCVITIAYGLYCTNNIQGSRYILFWNKAFYKEYICFSWWSLFGSFANAGVQQGINILINIFSGVVANAAYGIANQVSSAVYSFVSNFQMAFNPQLVQSYAAGDEDRFPSLIYRTSKLSYYLLFIISLPVIICMPILLSIWLKEVPEYTVSFCRWTLGFLLIDALSAPLWIAVQAIGNIKRYQIIMSCIIILTIPISFVSLKLGITIVSVFIIRVLINIASAVYRLYYLKRRNIISITRYLSSVITPCGIITILSIPLPYYFNNHYSGWLSVIGTSAISTVIVSLVVYTIGMTAQEKFFIKGIIEKVVYASKKS